MGRDYSTADLRRCYECGVLPGRDHHFDCSSRDALEQRRQWLNEEQMEEEKGGCGSEDEA